MKKKKEPLNFFLTIYHSYSFVILLSQQWCQVKWPPWSLEDLPIEKERKYKHCNECDLKALMHGYIYLCML